MSLPNSTLAKLQKLGKLAKEAELKKEEDIKRAQFDYAPENKRIESGRGEVGKPKQKSKEIERVLELSQIIKQARERQFELSQAKILSELKQTEFFEKQAKPVVQAVEESTPDDNVEEYKELKSRLFKAGIPLDKIIEMESLLKSVIESVGRNDSDSDKIEMLYEYYPILKSSPSVKGYENVLEKAINGFYQISQQDIIYEKYRKQSEISIAPLGYKISENIFRELIKNESQLDAEHTEKLIRYLISKNLVEPNTSVSPPPVKTEPLPPAPSPVEPDGVEEKKAEPIAPAPVPVPVPVFDDYFEALKEKAFEKPASYYIGRIESRGGLKKRVDREAERISPPEYKKQLAQFITEYIVYPSPEWNLVPETIKPSKPSIVAVPKKEKKKGKGLNYWMAGNGNPYGKPIPAGFKAPTFQDFMTKSNDALRKQMTGRGVNISKMNPSQLMNTLALNIASQKAGNNGVSDIINSTIDEMLRRQIISKAEHKRLWYEFVDH